MGSEPEISLSSSRSLRSKIRSRQLFKYSRAQKNIPNERDFRYSRGRTSRGRSSKRTKGRMSGLHKKDDRARFSIELGANERSSSVLTNLTSNLGFIKSGTMFVSTQLLNESS